VSDRIVIVGYDARPQSEDALALGAMLARSIDARLLITHAHRVGETSRFGSLLHDASRHVPYGVRVQTRAVASDSPAHALATLADLEGANVVVVGSSHRGAAGRVLMGSVAERLLRELPCALAVAPRGFGEHSPAQIRTIGVAYDGEPESVHALEHAAAMAAVLGARLRLIAVVEQPEVPAGAIPVPEVLAELTEERRGVLSEALEKAAAGLPPDVAVGSDLLSGPPAAVITQACHEDVDLLVSGSRGHGPLRRVLLGSVSRQLMNTCPCPMYVVSSAAVKSPISEAA
jgi:nucleotide-binding universal stress UspA family protein